MSDVSNNTPNMTPQDEAQALLDVLAVLAEKGAEFVRAHNHASAPVAPYQSEVLDAVRPRSEARENA